MENIGNSGVSGNRITSKYTYLGNSLEFQVMLEPCEQILTENQNLHNESLGLSPTSVTQISAVQLLGCL